MRPRGTIHGGSYQLEELILDRDTLSAKRLPIGLLHWYMRENGSVP